MADGGAAGERRVTRWLAGGAPLVLLLAACSNGLAPSAAEPPPAGGEPSAPAPAPSALERQIHDLVNQRRATQSLPALQWDDRIAAVAREHSEAMASAGRLSHDGFDQRAARIGTLITLRSMAENVAYDSRSGPDLARQVVAGWIASAGHRQNIEGEFTVTGVGTARAANGMHYFTQIFVLSR